ncbi:MAG: dTMP kinase [bacterium]|nr:dTMP kinase [bacterium]
MKEKSPKKGWFITLEGGEGSGKTTQLVKLTEALRERSVDVISTREPGGTEVGREIRQILLDGQRGEISPTTELLLYAADRAQHVREVIEPALKARRVVLCDRFQDSTTVYQGYARGLNMEWVNALSQIATAGLKPDWTLLLGIPPEVGLRRSQDRLAQVGSGEDRFEKESLEFHQKVRESFLDLAKQEPGRYQIFDAMKDPETLHQEILSFIESKIF